MKHSVLWLMVSVMPFGLAGCAQEDSALRKPPGTYRDEVSSTDAEGTTTTRKSTTIVEQDAQGKKKATVQSKTTKDPRGLFNKTTTNETNRVVTEDDDK